MYVYRDVIPLTSATEQKDVYGFSVGTGGLCYLGRESIIDRCHQFLTVEQVPGLDLYQDQSSGQELGT